MLELNGLLLSYNMHQLRQFYVNNLLIYRLYIAFDASCFAEQNHKRYSRTVILNCCANLWAIKAHHQIHTQPLFVFDHKIHLAI